MNQMAAIEDDDIVGVLMQQLFLIILFVLKLKLADAAFVVLGLLPFKQKLKGRVVRMWNYLVKIPIYIFFFLIEQCKQIRDNLEQFMILIDLILLMHPDEIGVILVLHLIW